MGEGDQVREDQTGVRRGAWQLDFEKAIDDHPVGASHLHRRQLALERDRHRFFGVAPPLCVLCDQELNHLPTDPVIDQISR